MPSEVSNSVHDLGPSHVVGCQAHGDRWRRSSGLSMWAGKWQVGLLGRTLVMPLGDNAELSARAGEGAWRLWALLLELTG